MFDYAKFATLESELVRLQKVPAFLAALKDPTFFTEGTRNNLVERQMACRNELKRVGQSGGLARADLDVLQECLLVPCEIQGNALGLLEALLAHAGLKPVPSLAVFDYDSFQQQVKDMPSLKRMLALTQALRLPSFFITATTKGLEERKHACRAELARHVREHGGFNVGEVAILQSCMLAPCKVTRDGSEFLELLITCVQESA